MKRQRLTGLVALLALLLVVGGVSANGGPSVDWWAIAGGGGQSSDGGDVTLNDMLGQPFAGSASGPGAVSMHAGYWPCNAPAAITDAAATGLPATNDVQLTWSGSGVFDVWRGDSPYFSPGDSGSVLIGDDVTSPFTSTAVLGDPAVNYTFLVLAQSACGASGPSNRTAEFDFALTPGSS